MNLKQLARVFSLSDVVINVRELPDYVARGVADGIEERAEKDSRLW